MDAEPLASDQLEELLLGLVHTLSRRVSLHVADEVRRSAGHVDAVAEAVARGRDHGLPGYTAWRRSCGLGVASQWSDLADTVSADNLAVLSRVYA